MVVVLIAKERLAGYVQKPAVGDVDEDAEGHAVAVQIVDVWGVEEVVPREGKKERLH